MGHCFGGEELVCMLEGLHDRLEFLHDFVDCLVVFEVLGDHDSQQFC